jgi:HAD superfamily hydrolase (TIGR01509 family)
MELIKTKIKAIIFDMDGTIIETEHIWDRIMIDMLAHHDVTTFTEEQTHFLDSLSGVGFEQGLAAIKNHFKLEKDLHELVTFTKQLVDAKFEQEIRFVEGFEAFHQKLQLSEIPSGIATNAERTNLDHLARKLDFKKFFGSHLYSCTDVGNRAKPDPLLFLHTAEKLGVRPEECVVFEDSIYGFKAAQAAGMQCIAISHGRNQEHLHEADHVIKNYHEAEDALRTLFAKRASQEENASATPPSI